MIVTKLSTYTRKSDNKLCYNLHGLDELEDLEAVNIFLPAEKLRGADKLMRGSIVDVRYKPGYQGRATVHSVDVSDEVLSSIDLDS